MCPPNSHWLSLNWLGLSEFVIGSVIGLIGLVYARDAKIGARLMCQVKTLRLIGKEEQELPKEVEIHFRNQSVSQLSLTSVYFWNAGKAMIKGDQVVEDDPPALLFDPAAEILKARVAAFTRAANKISIEVPSHSKNRAILSFDFLDPGDGVRIEILHTSKQRFPAISGTVRGIPKGILSLQSTGSPLQSVATRLLRHWALDRIYIAFGLFAIIIGSLPKTWLSPIRGFLESVNLKQFRIALLMLGFLYLVWPIVDFLRYQRRRYPPILDSETGNGNSGDTRFD